MSHHSFRKFALLFSTLSLFLFAGACAKKAPSQAPAVPVPPAPASPAPTVTISASSKFVQSGTAVTLNWTSTNATDLNISPGVGKVAPEGSTAVTPTESTTYSIAASGPGGSAEASVRITVSPTAPPAPEKATPTMEELFRANVFDAFFDFNKNDIRPDAREALSKTAQFLRANPEIRVNLEGHCDERGSTEYNLGLGERRAQAAKNFLVSLGVPADRMETLSWGKERPFCTEHDENCWQQNRRAHFVMAK
ncbi:MAG TPA: peptidoglycan-associated lipoprotein Pal [Candidatus Acidoferrales bacterium]|nr:peptidoglycan-associated lipoprotein Pal [Candidatus Acidoferrales bacterium]